MLVRFHQQLLVFMHTAEGFRYHRECPLVQYYDLDWPKKRTTLASHAINCLLPPHVDYLQDLENWMPSVSVSSREADLRRLDA